MLIKVKYKVMTRFLPVLLCIPKIGNMMNKESNDIK